MSGVDVGRMFGIVCGLLKRVKRLESLHDVDTREVPEGTPDCNGSVTGEAPDVSAGAKSEGASSLQDFAGA